MRLVFDACALIAALKHEPNHEIVLELLAGKDNDCFVHGANLCEVFYDVAATQGETRAEVVVDYLLDMGLEPCDDMDREFWQEAGRYKARYHRVSLADCFCLALSVRLNGELVTCDHEFDAVAASGVCKMRFIR